MILDYLICLSDDGTKIRAKSVVIATGTFLKGQINIGLEVYPAGRIGDEPSIGNIPNNYELKCRIIKYLRKTNQRDLNKCLKNCLFEINWISIRWIVGLANTLESLDLKMGRLKTGTPPRLKADTIDYSVCTLQKGDMPPLPFSFMNERVWINVCRYNFLHKIMISPKLKNSLFRQVLNCHML